MNGAGLNSSATLCSRIEWVQARFDSASPPALFAGYMFFSVLMVIATSACGLGQFSVITPAHTRVKGFFWELNWGINHLSFIPIGLFFCALVLREVKRQMDRLCRAHMLVDGTFNELPLADVQKDWENSRPGPIWFGLITSIAVVACWGEWFNGSLGPVFGFIPPESLETMGWTSGAVLEDSGINKTANVLLTFLAFTAQAFVVTFFVYTVSVVMAFAIWIYRYDNTPERKIIPNVASTDVRLGFEVFEPLMIRILGMALAFTFVLFSIRMQIIYNNSPSQAATALEFVLQDVVTGFATNMGEVLAGQQNELFEISLAPIYGTVVTCACMVLIVSLVTMYPTLILYFLANGSREVLLTPLLEPNNDPPPFNLRGVAKEDCKVRLKNMDFWPMRYPRPIELLAYIVFAAFCFIFYKFTVVLFGVFVMRLVYAVYKVLSEKVPATGS